MFSDILSEALALPGPPAIGQSSQAPCNWTIGHPTAASDIPAEEEAGHEAGCGRYYRWMPPHY